MRPAVPSNEAVRLEALRGFALLDTPAEPAFDHLARTRGRPSFMLKKFLLQVGSISWRNRSVPTTTTVAAMPPTNS